ncbi:hypothetical protein [Intestinimonas butyriciproducens]|uniref:hypothetical protein n=1 Tax=Intestinimonas butyriciproducens TaxID=1297617 RepID=UPI0019582FA4|nr:hypothetical protein [Intestinimonas butyriciproducens]MBM6974970.1 hypothetical protein [Intestinimonas butyriciproducens]
MELLELLAKQKQCTYISDLKFLQKSQLHFPYLKSVDLSTYPEREWKEAAWYLLHRRCRRGEQARRLLIG